MTAIPGRCYICDELVDLMDDVLYDGLLPVHTRCAGDYGSDLDYNDLISQ